MEEMQIPKRLLEKRWKAEDLIYQEQNGCRR
jgi:hypothetical protein